MQSKQSSAWRRRAPWLLTICLLCLLAVPVSAGYNVLLQIFRGPAVDGLKGAQGVTVSPDGGYVYVAGRTDDALTLFRRDATAERLSYAGVIKDGVDGVFGLDGANRVAASRDLRHVYVASTRDSALVVLRRDASRDTLSFADVKINGVGGVYGLTGAADVVVSPDGRHVAVIGRRDDALALFRRSPASDFLTPVDLEMGGFGLARPEAVTMDPAGDFAYVAAYEDHAISYFRRDASNDSLSFAGVVADGIAGINGLRGAVDIAISPDGKHAYVASFIDGTLTIFARHPASGALTKIDQLKGTFGGVSLAGANNAAVSPDGTTVTVASRKGVVCFDRSPNGHLVFASAIDTRALAGGFRAGDLTFSGDSKNLFVTSPQANALASLGRRATQGPGLPRPGDGEGRDDGTPDVEPVGDPVDEGGGLAASSDDDHGDGGGARGAQRGGF